MKEGGGEVKEKVMKVLVGGAVEVNPRPSPSPLPNLPQRAGKSRSLSSNIFETGLERELEKICGWVWNRNQKREVVESQKQRIVKRINKGREEGRRTVRERRRRRARWARFRFDPTHARSLIRL